MSDTLEKITEIIIDKLGVDSNKINEDFEKYEEHESQHYKRKGRGQYPKESRIHRFFNFT